MPQGEKERGVCLDTVRMVYKGKCSDGQRPEEQTFVEPAMNLAEQESNPFASGE